VTHGGRVSVIIPARSCPCRQALKVLAQSTPPDQLVIVANGLKDVDECRRRVSHHPLVTWVDAGRALGAARARNVGVAAASGAKVLLFCDADDLVDDHWLASLARPLMSGSADLAGGALNVRNGSRTGTIVAPAVDYAHRQALFGGNLGITHDAWQLLKGFNESFAYCEDTDFAWRAAAHGLIIKVVRDAIVHVSLRPTLKELQQRFRWGRGSVQVLDAHNVGFDHLPGLRVLLCDKQASGFAASPFLAAFGQWAGQLRGIISRKRLSSEKPRPSD